MIPTKPHWAVAFLALALSHLHGQSKTEVELRRQAEAAAVAQKATAAAAGRAAKAATTQRKVIADESTKAITETRAIVDRNTGIIRDLQAAIQRNADTMAITRLTTETTKVTGLLALIGVIVTAAFSVLGVWLTMHRSNKTDAKVEGVQASQAKQEQVINGRFTRMAQLIREHALLEGADIERQRARKEEADKA